MRKDRIEERITGIERDMKELRSDIQQEMRSMLAGLKEFQEILIDERMSEIQDAQSKGYRQIAYESCIADAERKFREQMSYDCPPDDKREVCIRHFVNHDLRGEVNQLDDAPPERSAETLQSILDKDREHCRKFDGTVCEGCFRLYATERDRLFAMGEKFARYRRSLSSMRGNQYFRQLPDDLAVSEIVEPLSHKARFAMLKGLTSRGMTFRELGEVTGFDGGHLTYHLGKLTSAELVRKDESSGLYYITDRGVGVMEIIKKMYAQ